MLVKRFRAGKAFAWRGASKLRGGAYFARVSALGRTGRRDTRELAFDVRHGGRIAVSPKPFSLRERCALLRSATLGSPRFARRLTVRFTLGARARVSVDVRRGGKRVRTLRPARLGAGSRKLTVGGLGKGTYRLTIAARAGNRRSAATLTATRP
jgi:hypothetical protein